VRLPPYASFTADRRARPHQLRRREAACDVIEKNATLPGAIGPMIEPILPAARDMKGHFVNNAAMESARRTTKRLTAAGSQVAGLVSQAGRRLLRRYI
jgi:hypothetical protein